MNQITTVDPDQRFVLNINGKEVVEILGALSELPAKISRGLMGEIEEQVRAQLEEPYRRRIPGVDIPPQAKGSSDETLGS